MLHLLKMAVSMTLIGRHSSFRRRPLPRCKLKAEACRGFGLRVSLREAKTGIFKIRGPISKKDSMVSWSGVVGG